VFQCAPAIKINALDADLEIELRASREAEERLRRRDVQGR
jgi:hypothetical protein